jgi:transcriptional regulator with XRE-family HTH domain
MSMIAVGAYLRVLRKAEKKTQKQVADAIRVNSKTIERWEAGENEPAFTDLRPYVRYVRGSLVRVLSLLLDPTASAAAAQEAARQDRARKIDPATDEAELMRAIASLPAEQQRLILGLIRQLLRDEESGGRQ